MMHVHVHQMHFAIYRDRTDYHRSHRMNVKYQCWQSWQLSSNPLHSYCGHHLCKDWRLYAVSCQLPRKFSCRNMYYCSCLDPVLHKAIEVNQERNVKDSVTRSTCLHTTRDSPTRSSVMIICIIIWLCTVRLLILHICRSWY